MSFLSTLQGLVSPGLTVATQAAAANAQGKMEGQEKAQQSMLEQLKLLRQKHEDELNDQLRTAQIGHLDKQTQVLGAPKPEEPYTLGPGQRRFGRSNEVVAEGGPKEKRMAQADLEVNGQRVVGSVDLDTGESWYNGQKVPNARRWYAPPDHSVSDGMRAQKQEEQEAEGLAFINDPNRSKLVETDAFRQQYQGLRVAHPDWSPGRIAAAVKKNITTSGAALNTRARTDATTASTVQPAAASPAVKAQPEPASTPAPQPAKSQGIKISGQAYQVLRSKGFTDEQITAKGYIVP